MYQEIERDFSKTADPISAIIDIWMLDNENAVLKYCKGIDYEIKTEIISMAQDDSNLETWVGEYEFFEGYFDPTFNHPPLNMSYHIQIYENEGSYYADLEISGHMTYTKIRAGVYGDEECINLVFLEYLPENMGNEIYDDCELLSFRKDGEDIYTYWGKVEAIFYENQSPGEIYFTKVGVE